MSNVTTIASTISILGEFRASMEARGKPASVTRLTKYMSILESIDTAFREGRRPALTEQQNRDAALSFHEASGLAFIYHKLWADADEATRGLFPVVLEGPHFADAERDGGASTKARNTVTELAIAALLKAGGMPCQAGVEPDLLAEVGGVKFYVACKRVASQNKVIDNIKTAQRQIDRTTKTDKRAKRGIVAIDISRLENSGALIFQTQSLEMITLEGRRKCDEFLRDYVRPLLQQVEARTCIGYLIRFSFAASIAADGVFPPSTIHVFLPSARPGSANDSIAQDIRLRLLKPVSMWD